MSPTVPVLAARYRAAPASPAEGSAARKVGWAAGLLVVIGTGRILLAA